MFQHTDVPTVIITGSDVDEPGSVSVYSVVNKSAKCSVMQRPTQITSTSQNQVKTYKKRRIATTLNL